MDHPDRLKETQLPPIDAFYSKLNETNISQTDYEHAQKVWEAFDMKTMEDYHNLYMKADVLLLSDVFENFREVCLKNYELDPAWYYTSPGLSWDAMLKKTGVKLDLISDTDMLLMVEKGIRGGVSVISNRYAKANNKYMTNFNNAKPSTYIQYLDANNLYGWAMSQEMPYKDFQWLLEEDTLSEIKDSFVEKRDNFGTGRGCILEVDLEYPHNLHDLHNDYPLAPERVLINKVKKVPLQKP